MKSWQLYTTIFFSLVASQAGAMEFKDLSSGTRYRLQGQIPVEVVCTLKNGSDTITQPTTDWNLVPSTGASTLGSSDYTVPVVDLSEKKIISHTLYTEYVLSLEVPGLSESDSTKSCTATYSFKKLAGSREADISALATY